MPRCPLSPLSGRGFFVLEKVDAAEHWKQWKPSGLLTLPVAGEGVKKTGRGNSRVRKKEFLCWRHEKGLRTGRGPGKRHRRERYGCGRDPAGMEACIRRRFAGSPESGRQRTFKGMVVTQTGRSLAEQTDIFPNLTARKSPILRQSVPAAAPACGSLQSKSSWNSGGPYCRLRWEAVPDR